MVNVAILAAVALILGLAGGYIYKQRKRGVKCIGCPNSCGGSCNGCTACSDIYK